MEQLGHMERGSNSSNNSNNNTDDIITKRFYADQSFQLLKLNLDRL